MPNRIKSRSQLPSWFNLEKYQEAATLDGLGWFWQLNVRSSSYMSIVLDDLPSPSSETNCNFLSTVEGSISQQLEMDLLFQTRLTPIIDTKAEAFITKYTKILLHEPNGLDYASLRDIDNFLSMHRGEEKASILRYLSRSINGVPDSHHELDFNTPMQTSATALVKVDLSLPESVLLDSFRHMVRQAQQESTPDPRTPDFSEWIRLGLLPYLDLFLWQTQCNVTIPNRVYADVIFTGDSEGEETVRKTTSKLANTILNGYFFPALGLCKQESS